MSGKKALEVNNKIEVKVDRDTSIYNSRITEVDQETFSIQIPEVKRIRLHLAKGDEVEITIFTDTTLYRFRTVVLGMKAENDIGMYVLKINPKMKKIERRNFFRIEICLDIEYDVIKTDERRIWHTIKPTSQASTCDLSGGGMKLSVDKELSEDTLLVIRLTICDDDNDETEIKALARVVRSFPRDVLDTEEKYVLGVKLEEIQESQREELIKYIFCMMRKKMHLFME